MSLQFASVRQQYVRDCVQLWADWLHGAPLTRAATRQQRLSVAITKMTHFMPRPNVTFAHMQGCGSFNRTTWLLKISRDSTAMNAITYEDFLELCSTAYHETRHAEQWYRVAQGLASGRLEFPDKSAAAKIQALRPPEGAVVSVRSRIQAFEGRAFQEDPAARKRVIQEWTRMPANVVEHAITHQSYFDNFTGSTRPAWFKRDSILREVDDWMRTRYKLTQDQVTSWLQGDDGPYKMYKDLPTEHDAFSIEETVVDAMKQSIGHEAHLKRGRTDPVFGP